MPSQVSNNHRSNEGYLTILAVASEQSHFRFISVRFLHLFSLFACTTEVMQSAVMALLLPVPTALKRFSITLRASLFFCLLWRVSPTGGPTPADFQVLRSHLLTCIHKHKFFPLAQSTQPVTLAISNHLLNYILFLISISENKSVNV